MANSKPKIITKQLKIYDLFSGAQNDLKYVLEEIIDTFKLSFLKGPLYTIVHELSMNALKALYKFVYFSFMLKEIGLDSISDEDWLSMYQTEIESHGTENFSRVCSENNLSISIIFNYSNDSLHIDVKNPGLPSKKEKEKLSELIKQNNNLRFDLQIKDDIKKPNNSSLSNIGLPMILTILKSLGIPSNAFFYDFTNDKTTASLHLQIKFFKSLDVQILSNENNSILKKEIVALHQQLDYDYIEFTTGGNIKKISENLFRTFTKNSNKNNTSEIIRKANAAEISREIKNIIPKKFFHDIFFGSYGVHINGKFENYRVWIKIPGSKKDEILYNISGYLKNDVVHTMWQKVLIESTAGRLSEGSILETLQLQKITKRYIPEMVTLKSKELISNGLYELPNEIEEATIFFADISGFTKFSEEKNPLDVLKMLNSTLGVAAKIIRRNDGVIDKFMGDAIFAIFKKPGNAVQASLEIQRVFKELNEFRELTDELPIHLRIGLHTGKILMGNVGTDHRMDWTAIGDIVNTASRIEKQCEIDRVLISNETYELIKDSVLSKANLKIKMKGKEKSLLVYYIDSFTSDDGKQIKNISI